MSFSDLFDVSHAIAAGVPTAIGLIAYVVKLPAQSRAASDKANADTIARQELRIERLELRIEQLEARDRAREQELVDAQTEYLKADAERIAFRAQSIEAEDRLTAEIAGRTADRAMYENEIAVLQRALGRERVSMVRTVDGADTTAPLHTLPAGAKPSRS